ncbi:MAG: rhodanese-like domain-containing protein [Chloroflexi bacterium]|nr:rhodanese-like domain-containing protein [Chloroflexota bacterium]
MSFLSKLFGPSAPNLSVIELSEKMKYGRHPLILDVRQPNEFHQGHIAGAKLMPLNELYRRMSELPKSREIICICASGNRSKSASKILAKEGFTVFNVLGGMNAWRHSKLPMQKG